MKRIIFLLFVAAAFSACGDKHKETEQPAWAELTFTTTLSKGSTADLYTNGSDPAPIPVTFNTRSIKARIPSDATRVWAVSPAGGSDQNRANAVPVHIPAEQTQAVSGEEPLKLYPQYASADVSSSVSLHFAPLCGTVCVQVSGNPSGVIRKIDLSSTTQALCGEASVDLTKDELYPGGSGKVLSVTLQSVSGAGSEARFWARTAARNLGKAAIRITTSESSYSFALSRDLDCSGAATIQLGIDLSSGKVTINGVEDTGASGDVSSHDFDALNPTEEPADVDRIPDFSRVGYHYGDAAIPTPAVSKTIDLASITAALSAGTAADTTAYIQSVIDQAGAAGGGVVLLKNGTYNVSRILFLDQSGVVLRGESESGTIIKFGAHIQAPIVNIGSTVKAATAPDNSSVIVSGRVVGITTMKAAGNGGNASFGTVTITTYWPYSSSPVYGYLSPIFEEHVPLGRLWVRVRNAQKFSPGDQVALFRSGTKKWISDIGMDKIASNGRDKVGSGTIQWEPDYYSFYWTRVVTCVQGDRVWLDAPVVMAMDTQYGGGGLVKYSHERVSECGVENLSFDCSYDASQVYDNREVDEKHAWTAVSVTAAEHCWIRNVTSRHMGFALCKLDKGSRCVSVLDCTSLAPVSAVQGARRYAFCTSDGSELGLFKNCSCDSDRHSFVNNGAALGPHVYTQCRSTNSLSVIGPHNNFATGTLFDCIVSDGDMAVEDGANQGTGHGWRGANTVFWNCENSPRTLVVQSLWASARNYAVGNVCRKIARNVAYDKDYYGNATTDYYVSLYGYGTYGENRPDGEWYPAQGFKTTGGSHVTLPHTPDDISWWPVLTLQSYANPLSLYECQMQERHAKGIYLNQL